MSLSLTTGRRQQTSSVKWSTTQQHQQHLSHQHFKTDTATATTTNNLLRQHYLNQTVRKQKSFIEKGQLMNKTLLSSHTERSYLSRGLSVGRSHDIQRSAFSRQLLKKHSIITTQSCNGKNERETLKTGDLIKRNITNCGQGPSGSVEFLRNSRHIQAWSSTSSILKSLDKELAQLNGVVGKCKNVNVLKGRSNIVDNLKVNNPKSDSYTTSSTHIIQQSTKPEINKVNLSIVLSSALNSTTEENYCASHSDQEADDNNDDESDETTSSDSNKIISSHTKSKDNKKSSNLRPTVPTQQKRALYHTSRLGTNLALSSNNITAVNSGLQNPQTFNASPSLTVQKRPPLVRAMSAPVRSFDETSKGSTFLVNKRKSRRRKLNARNISCDKNASDVLHSKDLSIDTKSALNRKVLTRSKSVAPDVITLVSLISSEGSDSEKEDNSITHTNLHKNSPTRRAPSLRKTGKSVSFQENYPPTFQFASKEYSHMLRRGSIAPLAQRIKSNRPPTAPPGSIFHNTHKLTNEMPTTNPEVNEEKENHLKNNKNNDNSSHIAPTANDKNLEDDYEFPHYVRTLKERECWKLYMKMSTKGVNITYDTILRGMLTPTEFRQLQKQREIEEAKALKEAEGNGLLEEKTKGSPTAIERLKENLLKN